MSDERSVREQESRVRKARVYYPSSGDWRYGFGYRYMYPMSERRDGPHFYNDDYPYTQLHMKTPDWVGLNVDDILRAGINGSYRVIAPGSYAPTHSYIGNRLNIFIDERRIITSVSYF